MNKLKIADIAVNWTDGMFRGMYRGKSVHADDSTLVLKRALDAGVDRILCTGTTLDSSRETVELIKQYNGNIMMRSTVGCHPTHCNEFLNNEDAYMNDLLQLAIKGSSEGHVTAIGEIGLDYERLEFCSKEIQLKYFAKQISVLSQLNLPFFLHMRGDCSKDFLNTVSPHNVRGVVHSFDGSLETMKSLIAKGLFIGLNFCSMRQVDNIDVIKNIPIDRIMIETDSPWCDVRPTHASFQYLSNNAEFHVGCWKPEESVKKERFKPGLMVKSRNEPCMARYALSAHVDNYYYRYVLRAVASIKGVSEELLAQHLYENSQIFFPK